MPRVCLAGQRGVILIEGPNIYIASGCRRGRGEEREKNSSCLVHEGEERDYNGGKLQIYILRPFNISCDI
jgi:hypothetical protein